MNYEEVLNILNRCSYQDLIEINHNLNIWEWDSRLGEKPENWDKIPNFMLNNTYLLPTKHKIIKPISNYIKSKVREKDQYKYHHLNFCNMTRLQHEVWWIKYKICKFFRLGFFSKKNEKIMVEILEQIANKDKNEWVKNTYSKK